MNTSKAFIYVYEYDRKEEGYFSINEQINKGIETVEKFATEVDEIYDYEVCIEEVPSIGKELLDRSVFYTILERIAGDDCGSALLVVPCYASLLENDITIDSDYGYMEALNNVMPLLVMLFRSDFALLPMSPSPFPKFDSVITNLIEDNLMYIIGLRNLEASFYTELDNDDDGLEEQFS